MPISVPLRPSGGTPGGLSERAPVSLFQIPQNSTAAFTAKAASSGDSR